MFSSLRNKALLQVASRSWSQYLASSSRKTIPTATTHSWDSYRVVLVHRPPPYNSSLSLNPMAIGSGMFRPYTTKSSSDNAEQHQETVLFQHRQVFLYRFANLIPLGQLAFSIYAGYLFFGPHYIHQVPSKDQTIGVSLLVYCVFVGICVTFVVVTRWLTRGRVIEIRQHVVKNKSTQQATSWLQFYCHRYLGIGKPLCIQVKVGNVRQIGNVERLARFGALANKKAPSWLALLWKQPLGTFPLQVVAIDGQVHQLVMPIGEYDHLNADALARLLVSGDLMSTGRMVQEQQQ